MNDRPVENYRYKPAGLMTWIENVLIEEKMIEEKDMNYFFLADSSDEAVGHINSFYSKYLLKPNF